MSSRWTVEGSWTKVTIKKMTHNKETQQTVHRAHTNHSRHVSNDAQSIFVSNFPNSMEEKHIWGIFLGYGMLYMCSYLRIITCREKVWIYKVF